MDTYFFDRYRKRYDLPDVTNRIPMPVATYADRLAAEQEVTDAMTPDKVAALLVEMADESIKLAEEAHQAATKNREEAARFVTDSQALAHITRAWRHKVMAAIEKRVAQRTGKEEHLQAMMRHMEDSIAVYQKLVALTDKTYVNPSDMLLRLSWHNGLKSFREDLADQQRFLDVEKIKRADGVYWLDTEDMQGNWKLGANYRGYFGLGFRVSDGPEQKGTVLKKMIEVDTAGRYTVFCRGLLAGAHDRSFAVAVAGQPFPPTHRGHGPRTGKFVWEKAGEIELKKGPVEIVVRDAGNHYECPDVVVLTRDSDWNPPD